MNFTSRLFRWVSLAAYFGLLALVFNWFTWLAPAEHLSVSIVLILTCLPLLCPLRGLLDGRPYTHAWTSFLALGYFALGVDGVAAVTTPTWIGALAVFLSVALFIGTTGYARYRGRELRS